MLGHSKRMGGSGPSRLRRGSRSMPQKTVRSPSRTCPPVPAVLDTLVFIPDEGIFYEVFRGVCSLTNLDVPEVARIRITM